jgi:hypothetical protein
MHKTIDVPMINNKREWANRLKVLKASMDKWLTTIPEKEITNEYLFYDEVDLVEQMKLVKL